MITRRTALRGTAAAAGVVAAGPVLGALAPSAAKAAAAPGASHVLARATSGGHLVRQGAAGTAVRGRGLGPSVPTGPGVTTTPGTQRATKGLSADRDLHLLRRATYGPTAASLADLRQTGAAAWLTRQLTPSLIDDSRTEGDVARLYPLLAMSSVQLRAAVPQYSWDAMYALTQAHVLRAVQSERQLLEVMVDLWSNHFNVTCPSGAVWSVRHLYDSQAIRPNALGRFEDLLLATAKHPAMLYYLNNADSRGTAPNENYGRELMELHTLGVDAGYTETDVRQAALTLTGMTVTTDGTDVYTYDPKRHYVGPVSVFGWSSTNSSAGGEAVATSFLKYLANHPATARHVCRKLAVRFVSDTPSDDLVDLLAQVFTANGTAIAPVLQTLLTSPEFLASSGQKVKNPFEDAVSALRTLGYRTTAGATTADWAGIYWNVNNAGQPPLGWKPPNGYPDVAVYWTNPFVQLWRWNAHQAVVEGWTNKGLDRTGTTWAEMTDGATPPTTMGALVDAVAQRVLLQPAPPLVRSAALLALGVAESDPVPSWRLQYSVDPVASLLLSAPLGGLR